MPSPDYPCGLSSFFLSPAGSPGWPVAVAGRAGAGLDGATGAERPSSRAHGRAFPGNANRSRPAPATPAEGPGTADDPLLTINMPAGEAGHARQVEVTFSPAEPELTPGAAQAVLAMLLRARETADRTE